MDKWVTRPQLNTQRIHSVSSFIIRAGLICEGTQNMSTRLCRSVSPPACQNVRSDALIIINVVLIGTERLFASKLSHQFTKNVGIRGLTPSHKSHLEGT